MAVLTQLIHNGIVIPPVPEPHGLSLRIRGTLMALSPKQEEMALAWARKQGTPYLQDPTFAANFMRDFSAELGVSPPLSVAQVDWAPCLQVVEVERALKEGLATEERKGLATRRKSERETLKAQYGFAIVNGQRVELGAYLAEPSGIFMGRGEHPLRGRWKQGATQKDVTLNLSPDAPQPPGEWARVWQPDSMWVARWEDKLSQKTKYIWLSDGAPIKQEREADKFDKAIRLDERITQVRDQIQRDLVSDDPRKRMLATACFLIDELCLRVGDEKDPDEADTVGATTLRPEHVTFRTDGAVGFHFLGKDSVEWDKTLRPTEVVVRNLKELITSARPSAAGGGGHPTRDLPQLFPDIDSAHVNAYLARIMKGLTAKVFRTHHATAAVATSLSSAKVRADSPEYFKWQAASMANLEAALLCNHTKKETGNWGATKQRYDQRLRRAEERVARCREVVEAAAEALGAAKTEASERETTAASPQELDKRRHIGRTRIERARDRLEKARASRSKALMALGKIRAQAMVAGRKRTWNLGTSLKSYVDPRVYHRWGQDVAYDVLAKYYPTILQRKFAWVREGHGDGGQSGDLGDGGHAIVVRTCLSSDLAAVAALAGAMRAHPQVDQPSVGLPADPTEIGRRYLPALDKDWQEALIALRDEHEVLAFVALGPLWQAGGRLAMDIQAFAHPDADSDSLASRIAPEVARRVQRYQAQHLVRCRLSPRDTTWFARWPTLAAALERSDNEDADNEDSED